VDRVAAALLGRVIRGSYPPGVRLPAELDLAGELGCGRSTIREALGRLSALGVVASRRGSGAHVLDWRREGTPALLPVYLAEQASFAEVPGLLVELLRMRHVLAREAVRLAARYANEHDLGEVRALLEASRTAKDPVEHALGELEFFRALVTSSSVWPAVWLANAFWGPMRGIHALLAPYAGGPPDDYFEAMSRLVDHVAARDEVRALEHLDRWLERVDRELAARLSSALADSTPTDDPKSARRGSKEA
jgi:DNA-binding FadR family transcriptional regulator